MTAVVGAGRRRERRGERRRRRARGGELDDGEERSLTRAAGCRLLECYVARAARARAASSSVPRLSVISCVLSARATTARRSLALSSSIQLYIYKISLILYSRIVDYICLYRLVHQMVTHVRLSLRLSLRCLFASPRTPPIPLGRATRETERERKRESVGGREGGRGRKIEKEREEEARGW